MKNTFKKLSEAISQGIKLGIDLCDIDKLQEIILDDDLYKNNKNFKSLLDPSNIKSFKQRIYLIMPSYIAEDAIDNIDYLVLKMLCISKFNNNEYVAIYEVSDPKKLHFLIKKLCKDFGNYINLNWIDVSKLIKSNFTSNDEEGIDGYEKGIFFDLDFNGDISLWNLKNLKSAKYMFGKSKFNNDSLKNWNMSNVTNMMGMFVASEFNGDISSWDVRNVKNMSWMFKGSKFNSDISKWNTKSLTTVDSMFAETTFNQDLGQWKMSKVKEMGYMFYKSPFNQDISKWDVHNCQYSEAMFAFSPFNQDLSSWDLQNCQESNYMFEYCPIQAAYLPFGIK